MKHHNSKRSAAFHSRVFKIGAISMVAMLLVALFSGLFAMPEGASLTLGAALPFVLGTVAEALDPEFKQKLLSGVEDIGTRVKSLEPKFDELDKSTKKTIEDITKLKNDFDGRLSQIEEFQLKMKRLELQLAAEKRNAYGNPIQRIMADEEKRTKLNALVRRAVEIRLSDAHKKALGEDSSPGSTMIDDALAQDMYDTLLRYGQWNTLGVRRLGTKETKFPVKTVRPVCNVILTEGGTISDDTNKAGTSVTLTVEVLAALLNVSLQLIQDSEFDVTADVLDDFAEAFAERLDYLAFRADGTADATNGGMTGILNFGTAATAAAGNTSIATLDFEDVTKCLTTVDAAVLSRMAKWWIHPTLLVKFLHIKDLNGRPIFLTAIEKPSPGSLGSILGYPVVPTGILPTTDAANAKVAIFGDPEAMVVGVRQDFQFEGSDHARWNTFERSFRGVGRAGVKGRRALGLAVLTLPAA
jgi:HK97 family phage major capsid protein